MTLIIACYLHSFAMSSTPVLGNALITTQALGVQRLLRTNVVLGTCLAASRNLLADSIQKHHTGYHKYPKYHASLKNALLLAHRIRAGKIVNL